MVDVLASVTLDFGRLLERGATVLGATVFAGTVFAGTVFDGTVFDGTVFDDFVFGWVRVCERMAVRGAAVVFFALRAFGFCALVDRALVDRVRCGVRLVGRVAVRGAERVVVRERVAVFDRERLDLVVLGRCAVFGRVVCDFLLVVDLGRYLPFPHGIVFWPVVGFELIDVVERRVADSAQYPPMTLPGYLKPDFVFRCATAGAASRLRAGVDCRVVAVLGFATSAGARFSPTTGQAFRTSATTRLWIQADESILK